VIVNAVELHETIRLGEIDGIGRAVEAARRLRPEAGVTSRLIAGGLAVFTGAGDPLSQAYGVGGRAVTADEIAALTEFYESRGAVARAFVSPFSDPSLARGLATGSYAPSDYENLLVCDALDADARRDERVTVATDVEEWARASLAAFTEGAKVNPYEESVGLVLATASGVVALEIRESGAVVATAALAMEPGKCAALFAGSTLPAFRKRGLHLALTRDRMARALENGAQLLRATAKPGSASERNFRRCGFDVLCTRTLWERPPN
jgi:hypothetical protein